MKTKKILFEEMLEYCGKLEDHFFDRKAIGLKPRNLQKVIVAFANSDGGEIVLGIKDDSDEPLIENRWQGAKDIEEFNQYMQTLLEIQPTISFSTTFLFCDAKPGYVLLLQIDKGAQVHKTSDNSVYIRLGAQSLPLTNPQKVIELSFAKGASSFEDEVLKTVRSERIIESKEIEDFLLQVSPTSDPLEFCLNQNLLDSNTFEPRIAGILLFSDDPSANMPRKCAVKIARYETNENDPERDHLKEIVPIEGPLYPLIYKTIQEVAKIMSSVKIWTTHGLQLVNYPPEAISEIIVNAIIHRDYSISDDVHIHIFNNRIEVFSPGKLPGYVTVENILDSRYARNSKIVRALNRYKNPPNKDMGEGLNTAFQKMKEWKLQSPIIFEENNGVKVILPHTPLATPEDAILEFLDNNETIRNVQARELTNIRSENAIKRLFYKLRDEGYIERVPGLDGPLAAWRKKGDQQKKVFTDYLF